MDRNVVVFLDIDGVLADNDARLKYIQGEKKDRDYDKFYGSEMADDKVIWGAADFIYWTLKSIKFGNKHIVSHVVALTGRPKRTATLTKMWMEQNLPEITSFIDEWVFRPDKDWTVSSNFKARKVDEIMKKMHNLWDAGAGEWLDIIIDDDPTNVLAMAGKIERNHPDDDVLPLTVGGKLFSKLLPAFACRCSNGSENCTSSEEECAYQSSRQCQKSPSSRAPRSPHR